MIRWIRCIVEKERYASDVSNWETVVTSIDRERERERKKVEKEQRVIDILILSLFLSLLSNLGGKSEDAML